jgi:hypothetical protein
MHYMLDPKARLIGAQLPRYVRDSLYWVLHAPRQTGKTTFLQSWERELAATGDVAACYVSIEAAQPYPDPERGISTVCQAIRSWAERRGLPIPSGSPGGTELGTTLSNWAGLVAPRPLVILFVETDCLQGDTMIAFLRQLRDGFADRGPGKFPVSLALVGMKDLKDYITAAKGGVPPNPGSPFNIKADSAILGNFSRENVGQLFAQRTAETGQAITDEALDYVWEQSGGQPWIVNNLFMRATMRVLDDESTETVTKDIIIAARKQMIDGRETHLDSLEYRLKDPRVKRVIEAVFTGDADSPLNVNDHDVQLCLDLGLVRFDNDKGYIISNPVYEETLLRFLDDGYRTASPPPSSWRWQKDDGTLDMPALLREFQDFWETNSEVWEEKADYTEAFPHLLLMAFLQRVTNGSGRIEREYAAGSGRMDIAVEYLGKWNIIEIKLWRRKQSYDKVKAKGLEQIRAYGAKFPHTEGLYLVIFDRRPGAADRPWEERLTWAEEGGVTIVGG